MKCLIVGATGTIGKAVADAFAAAGHEVLRASRKGEVAVDISDPASIKSMYDRVGKLDAVVSCAGAGAFAPLTELTDEQLDFTVKNKLLGQVNLVRFGMENITDGGVFVLTSGIFSRTPPPGVPALAMVNGGLESFVIAAAKDLPRDVRIGCMCPPFITETAEKMGMSTEGTLSAADNARAYLAFAAGKVTGEIVLTASR
jgi:NAD(P)-dependent dehydrogenase (short-subunit alcohol dehydrogenase family)